jgi:hypothetical protein
VSEFDFSHALAVARRVSGTDAKLVALLHDTVEDGVLHDYGLAEVVHGDILSAVLILTRPPSRSYSDYIADIGRAGGYAGVLARKVKRADLAENLERIDAEHESLRDRWEAALAHLSSLDLERNLT